MNTRAILILLLVLMTPGWGAMPPAEKLNFVVILIDDLGWKDLSAYGSTFYETPNVDRLAGQGIRFTDAYASAPVCSPTRAGLLTGKYPATLNLTDWIPGRKQWPWARLLTPEFNQQLPLQERTIAEALAPLGYVSASIGKWHLGGEGYLPTQQGFNLNIGGTSRGSPPSYFSPYKIPTLEDGPEGEHLTDRLSREAVRFIRENRGKPFFLYLTHFSVHIPLQGKQEKIAKYRAKANPDDPQHHPVYAAMIESMDESVGRILQTLEELDLDGRTIIFFTSDNGGLMYEGKRTEPVTSNAPLRAGKGHLYEGGIRVPLIVKWPEVTRPGTTYSLPVTSADILPTVLEMAGVESDSLLDGKSLVPVLSGNGILDREAVYWHYPHYSNQGGEPGGAIRQGDYKLIEFYRDGKLELYNLREDIGERHDLSQKMPEKTAELHGKLKAWRSSVGAAMPAPNPDYDPEKAGQGLTGAQR
ncbi:MAG: sulfatase [Acidobacteriota bacterium]